MEPSSCACKPLKIKVERIEHRLMKDRMVCDPTTSKDCEVCRLVVFRDPGSVRNCFRGTAWNTRSLRNSKNLTELILCSFQALSHWREQAGTQGSGQSRPSSMMFFIDPAR
jgi:hypothetical protein